MISGHTKKKRKKQYILPRRWNYNDICLLEVDVSTWHLNIPIWRKESIILRTFLLIDSPLF